jgi:hypothetical protein
MIFVKTDAVKTVFVIRNSAVQGTDMIMSILAMPVPNI